ncbi:CysB family transcriptional regulator [Pseudohongiella nitratireducens]|uniref:CysB family transcriptional regulator n=1 Tax=Pseudohongiella nitratireducens TaxID=1768907 RepID=A0A917GKV4_9GAMM|nr:HTH-type transcriptional regulator CysB [Pseudohongiella nitratireducens]GGG49266.1 CysB family transcriptional regulator [Pseudohongiella nitratireducens]|tara:strand:- start:8742 stop:9716 length:975 start_codon:yes stop_codon:yes gene_type:complete
MKLQQLRYIWEVAAHGMNVSAAAEALHTSQSGVSKQILALEDELGVEIFIRNGKHIAGMTAGGTEIVEQAGELLLRAENIKRTAAEYKNELVGSLSLATTHTQSRYVLPPVLSTFIRKFPDVSLQLHQGTPLQIAELAAKGVADFAIATEAMEQFNDLMMMPCYQWNRVVLVPAGHPLVGRGKLQLADLAEFPLVTYVLGFTGRSRLDDAFASKGLQPKVVFTAADADVIKTYVRLGMGIGIVASMAYDADKDSDLVALDASHLFEFSLTKIGFRRGMMFRAYMFDFVEMFAPHLSRAKVHAALKCSSQSEVDALFSDSEVPTL